MSHPFEWPCGSSNADSNCPNFFETVFVLLFSFREEFTPPHPFTALFPCLSIPDSGDSKRQMQRCGELEPFPGENLPLRIPFSAALVHLWIPNPARSSCGNNQWKAGLAGSPVKKKTQAASHVCLFWGTPKTVVFPCAFFKTTKNAARQTYLGLPTWWKRMVAQRRQVGWQAGAWSAPSLEK